MTGPHRCRPAAAGRAARIALARCGARAARADCTASVFRGARAARLRSASGQAAVLVVAALFGLLAGGFILGAVARGVGIRSGAQRTADLAALAGARAMLDAYPRLFEAPEVATHLDKAAYLEIGRAAAEKVAVRNNDANLAVSFPNQTELAPTRIRVAVTREVTVKKGRAEAATDVQADAEAELSADALAVGVGASGGEYPGPFATRQGQRMRPDVAEAFDRMQAAAQASGVTLIINSAFRSDAEQAVLWSRHPDPKWVAPPGTSLHRNGTELDLGPPTAYGWLAANAGHFHFVKRYDWEAWHFGFTLNQGSSAATAAPAEHADGHPAIPSFVPAAYADDIANAAQRWNVSATLLSAQLYAESGFNPFATSGAGAQGIAQFMPGTAQSLGLSNPYDPRAAIDAQGHLMRDLLRQFGSVPLALAAYNAGSGRVSPCMCVPPIAETQAYVAQILGLMNGAGDASAGGLDVRLVR